MCNIKKVQEIPYLIQYVKHERNKTWPCIVSASHLCNKAHLLQHHDLGLPTTLSLRQADKEQSMGNQLLNPLYGEILLHDLYVVLVA